MKRFGLIFALILTLGAFAATANAIDVVSNVITNVADAKVSNTDDVASIEGIFVKKVNNNEYIFRDKTGEIIVRVDPSKVAEVDACLGKTARIDGTVSQDIVEVEVDAKRIIIPSNVDCSK